MNTIHNLRIFAKAAHETKKHRAQDEWSGHGQEHRRLNGGGGEAGSLHNQVILGISF